MSLLNVKQERGESLRAFMDRFSKVCMGIRNLNPDIAMHHLVFGHAARKVHRKPYQATIVQYGRIENKSDKIHAN